MNSGPSHARRPSRDAILAGVFLLAASVRFIGLDQKSLWLDESISLARILHSFPGMLADVAANDSHPPCYYAFLHFLTYPFRAGGLSDGTLRYPSALAGLLTVGVLYLIERRLRPARRFPLATAFFSISAFTVYYSQEARNYVLAGLWITLSTYFLLRALDEESPSTPHFLGFVLSSTLALYTFYYSLFFLVSQAVATTAAGKLRPQVRLRWLLLFATPLALFAAYLPVIFSMRERLQTAGAPMGFSMPDAAALARSPAEISQGFHSLHTSLGMPGLALFSLLALFPLFAAGTGQGGSRPATRFLLILFFGPFLCLLVFPFKPHLFESKHIFAVTPFYFLLVADVFCGERERQAGTLRACIRWGGMLSAVAILALNLSSLAEYFSAGFVKEDWRTAAALLSQEAGGRDLVIPSPGYLQYPLRRYLPAGKQDRIKTIPELLGQKEGQGDDLPRILGGGEISSLWLVELLQSPVSFEDPLVRQIVGQGRKIEFSRAFPGRLGTVRITRYR